MAQTSMGAYQPHPSRPEHRWILSLLVFAVGEGIALGCWYLAP